MPRSWWAWVVVAACGSPSTGPSDPFAEVRSTAIGEPARALATWQGGAAGPGPAATADVALARELAGEVAILSESAGGELVAGPVLAVGAGPRAVVAADVDGDGTMDLVTADATARTLTWIVALPDGGAQVAGAAALDRAPVQVAAVDVDGDGASELVVAEGTSLDDGAVELWRVGPSGLERAGQVAVPGAGGLAADASGDGIEIVVAARERDVVVLLRAGRDGSLAVERELPLCAQPRAPIRFGDDVAVACADGISFVSGAAALPSAGNLYGLASADFDGDGGLDLAAVDLPSHSVAIYLASADGRALLGPTVHEVSPGPVAIAVADFGGDGDDDLAVLAFEARRLDVLINNGGGEP